MNIPFTNKVRQQFYDQDLMEKGWETSKSKEKGKWKMEPSEDSKRLNQLQPTYPLFFMSSPLVESSLLHASTMSPLSTLVLPLLPCPHPFLPSLPQPFIFSSVFSCFFLHIDDGNYVTCQLQLSKTMVVNNKSWSSYSLSFSPFWHRWNCFEQTHDLRFLNPDYGSKPQPCL